MMYRFIKFFYGMSNSVLALLTITVLVAQFWLSAINSGRIAIANQRIEKLTMLSMAELGRVKVRVNG